MLLKRGFKDVHLQPIQIDQWEQHPLLQRQYDMVLCSHLLEHLAEPVALLRKLSACLEQGGIFLGLVPINELRENPQHVQIVDRNRIGAWITEAGLKMQLYVESDPWTYWFQPFFTCESTARYKLNRIISLTLGIPATLLRHRSWQRLSPVCATLTLAKATQAAFVCSRAYLFFTASIL